MLLIVAASTALLASPAPPARAMALAPAARAFSAHHADSIVLPLAIERVLASHSSFNQRRDQKLQGLAPAAPSGFRLAGVPAEGAHRPVRLRSGLTPPSARAPPVPV